MDPEQIKLYSDIAKPIIEPIISVFVKPKIEKIANWFRRENVANQVSNSNLFERKFEEYLERTFKRCKNINVLVFPNQQISLEAIYQPLTLYCTKNNHRVKIDKFYDELIRPYEKILISDTAGMGKSTLLKFLALKIIEQNVGIPILIDLRNLTDRNLILDEIFAQLNPIDRVLEKDLILKFIETGNFIFLVDGFDEIQQKNSEIVIRDIRQFIDKAHNNWFFLTSRPEPALTSFGDFQQFNIQPLSKEEAYGLIRLYDNFSGFGIAENLIGDIQPRLEEIQSFLANPFLVSLLYKTYTYTKDVPASKITFYDEIYSALFKHHDLSKDGWRRPKHSNLEIQQFRIVLRQLAFDTLKDNVVSYKRQELISYISKAREKCIGIVFNETDYLSDLLLTVPLFIEEGLQIKWAHKSFQDFFAAEYLSLDSKKEEKLNQIFAMQKANYFNMLDLFYELDYKTFRRTIIRNLLADFQKFDKNSYSNFEDYPIEIVDKRKAYMVFNPIVYLYRKTTPAPDNVLRDSLTSVQRMEAELNRNGNVGGFIRHGSGFGAAYYGDFRKQLLSLLLSKGETFVSPVTQNNSENDAINLLSETPIPLFDSREAWYNSKDNFEKINQLLQNTNLAGNAILIKHEAIKTLESINREWQNDLSSSTDV